MHVFIREYSVDLFAEKQFDLGYLTLCHNKYVTRHDILCPNAVKRDVGKTRCKSDVILRNCTLLRNLLSGIC